MGRRRGGFRISSSGRASFRSGGFKVSAGRGGSRVGFSSGGKTASFSSRSGPSVGLYGSHARVSVNKNGLNGSLYGRVGPLYGGVGTGGVYGGMSGVSGPVAVSAGTVVAFGKTWTNHHVQMTADGVWRYSAPSNSMRGIEVKDEQVRDAHLLNGYVALPEPVAVPAQRQGSSSGAVASTPRTAGRTSSPSWGSKHPHWGRWTWLGFAMAVSLLCLVPPVDLTGAAIWAGISIVTGLAIWWRR